MYVRLYIKLFFVSLFPPVHTHQHEHSVYILKLARHRSFIGLIMCAGAHIKTTAAAAAAAAAVAIYPGHCRHCRLVVFFFFNDRLIVLSSVGRADRQHVLYYYS